MKFEIEVNSVDDVAKIIQTLISKGEELAEESGKHFWAGNEEYIPASSPEFEDYKWIREENYLPDGEGFWYSSSMQQC